MRIYADLERHLHSDLGTGAKGGPGYHTSDDTLDTVLRQSLADSFYKKLCPLGDTKGPDLRALEKFCAINARLPTTSFEWQADNEAESWFWDLFKGNLDLAFQPNVGRQVFDSCKAKWHAPWKWDPPESDAPSQDFDLAFMRQNFNVGPGAAQRADPSSIVTKLFQGEMSYTNTEHLIRLYRSALVETGLWAAAERRRFESFGFTRVDGGKIFFAKKNAEISRTCCTEPNLNMMFQKAAGAFAERRLRECFGISLSTQPMYNRELARRGSIDGSFATIDLVSASDSIGLQMFKAALGSCPFKDMVLMSRCENAVLPNGVSLELSMVSTMGNGFTFPLQTIMFASAVRACYEVMGFPCDDSKTQFGVFGDDIIVRREAYEFIVRMLNKLGFEVNMQKSFSSGPFRESCGGDYFKGSNVRGVYIKSLETSQDICSAINRLTRWSARTGIELKSTLHYLKWQVLDAPLVPPSESDDAGLHVPFVCTQPKLDARYWFHYRKWKVRKETVEVPEADYSLSPEGTGVGYLSGHYRRLDRAEGFDYGVTAAVPMGLSFDNPRIFITLRGDLNARVQYKLVDGYIPWWDYVIPPDWEVGSYDVWKDVVRAMLS